MNGKKLPLFPTPYPDEILYSVLCRYWIRIGRPLPRALQEELYGDRKNTNVLMPQYLERLSSLLPSGTGMTATYFLHQTTVFPYFHPFLTQQRKTVFQTYFKRSSPENGHNYFALGIGKMRYPRARN